jgi:hypothetical protein
MYEITNMPSSVEIGYTGEQSFRTIQIDLTKWMEIMPDGVPSIVHIRPGESNDDAYIAATTFEDNILTWTVQSSDLGNTEGVGSAQVWLEESENDTLNKRGMSVLFATLIRHSVASDDPTVPAAQVPWMQQMTLLKTETVAAKLAAEDAEEDAVAAKEAAEAAQNKAELAAGLAIAQGGQIKFGIDEDTGHLIFYYTDDVPVQEEESSDD